MLYALCYTGLIMGLGFGWRGFIYATLIIALLFFIICIIHLIRRYDLRFFKPDKQLLVQILNPALPLIPHLVGSSLILMIDRILIERMLSIREVGIYAIAIMVGNILKLLVVTIMKMWGPWLSEQLSDCDDNRKRYIARCTWQAAFALAITAVAVAVAGSFYVQYLFDESFHPAIGIIPWAVLAFFIQGLYQLISHNIIFTGKTHVLMKITFITGLCNIVFSIAFIHWFGLVGAIQATALSLFIQFCLVFIHIQRNMPLPFFGSSKA
jgi:O-antigen/teichoic acid export membrane protein